MFIYLSFAKANKISVSFWLDVYQLWNSTSLLHPREQFPNAWKYHVHLYKQWYTSINTMEPHSCLTTLSPRYERTLAWKVQINPRTTAKDRVKLLEESGTKVSTIKRVGYRHNLKGRSARKKPLLQKCHKKARLRFATKHGDKDSFLEKCLMVWWNKNLTVRL